MAKCTDTQSASPAPIGLVAGAGRFPVAVAEHARALGAKVVCVGIRGAADPQLQHLTTAFHWCGLARIGAIIRCFRRAGVRQWMMSGKVDHRIPIRQRWWFLKHVPDLRTLRMWYGKRRNNGDDAILLNIVNEFAKDGLECRSALELCPTLLAPAGLLTRRAPTPEQQADIEFGWQMALAMGRLDVGQSVMVHNRAVLAVEAIEGTDQAIARAGQLCPRGGFTVVKVAKPQQDMRFDVPAVGLHTIETMHRAGAAVLAIEAGRTIMLDEAKTRQLADHYGIAILAQRLEIV